MTSCRGVYDSRIEPAHFIVVVVLYLRTRYLANVKQAALLAKTFTCTLKAFCLVDNYTDIGRAQTVTSTNRVKTQVRYFHLNSIFLLTEITTTLNIHQILYTVDGVNFSASL